MENSVRSLEYIEETAAAWLLRREAPEWSAADDAELALWLKASASHRVAFIRLQSVWRQTSRLQILNGGAADKRALPSRGVLPKAVSTREALLRAGIVSMSANATPASTTSKSYVGRFAAALAVLAVSGVLGLTISVQTGDSEYRTAIGGIESVPLADGSKIILNTNSKVDLQFGKTQRRVNLIQGEAFFTVAKDPTRPFVVYVNDQRVVAVGTQFAVRLKSEAVQVSVTEGRVRLERAPAFGEHERMADLLPGYVAYTRGDRVSVERNSVVDVEQALGWRSGNVVLRRALLADAVAEFNRYNHRQLVIGDPSLMSITVGGNFRSDNIDGFVRLLQEGFHVRAEERGTQIVLLRKSATE